jgi:hypothetical protein
MARLENPAGTVIVEADDGVDALRTTVVSRGFGYCVANLTGTIAAALGANSSVFAMRLDPGTSRRAFIERIRLQFTTIVAFTTPITAGRRLALFRGSGAASSGGTSIATAVPKHTTADTSEFNVANGGDIRIATTGALTVTGITFESDPLRLLSLVHVGAAGAYIEQSWEFRSGEAQPIQLDPGQLLAIRNPVAMDAAGTWQLSVNAEWHEAPALDWI